MDPESTPPAGSEPGQSFVPVQMVQPAPAAQRPFSGPPPRKKSMLARILVVLLLLLCLSCAGLAVWGLWTAIASDDLGPSLPEKHVSGSRFASNKVAIITVDGIIVDGETFAKKQIDQVKRDKDVKAVVLRIDSPGGTVSGADYIYHHLNKVLRDKDRKIPVVVSMGSLAASGGYYVAMVVGDEPKTIYAERSTWTGSIGVMVPLFNLSELMKQYGVEDTTIVTHPLKEMGSFSRPMSPEEAEVWRALVDDGFTQFKDVIKTGRPKFRADPAALDKLATGQVFSSRRAKQAGLIDEIGFLEDAIDRVIELAKLDKDDVRVVRYESELTLRDLLLSGSAQNRSPDWTMFLESSSPRAYYLYTRVPPLIQSRR